MFDVKIFMQLFGCALVSVILSVSFYLLDKFTSFSKLPYWLKQIIIGVIFGAASVFGTEFGVDIGGAVANARDAAPICAGLLFGAPSGIIAGIIGGVERWFSVYWGGGMYSRLACTVSTVFAGVYAAFLRKFIFDNKRPTPVFGFATGAIMEIIHMTVLFLTHLGDTEQAFTIVKICTLPMTLCNGVSVWLSVLLITIAAAGKHSKEKTYRRISQQVQTPLLIAVVFAFVATSVFVFILQTNSAVYDTQRLMEINLTDVSEDIGDEASKLLENTAEQIAETVNSDYEADLNSLKTEYGVADIRIVGINGNVLKSTAGDKHSYSEKFAALNIDFSGNVYDFVTKNACFDSQTDMKLQVFTKLSDKMILQVEYDSETLCNAISSHPEFFSLNRHIGENGYIIIADKENNIIAGNGELTGTTLAQNGIDTIPEATDEMVSLEVNGEKSYVMFSDSDGAFTVIGVMSEDEVFAERDNMTYVNSYMEILVFASLFIVIYVIVKNIVVTKIQKVNSSLGKIIGGDLNTVVDVRSSDEFASLSDDINTTVDTLKHYIDEAASRIDRELAFAKSIQHSALPSVFPAFPDRTDFDVYAYMNTAKEVGGDFYDFYLLGENRFAFLVADVSGKGIPAAMFMMTAKTMIKNFAEQGLPLDEVFEKANTKLCSGNEAEMFVTAWMGIADLETGKLSFVNAGHNPPLILRKNGGYEYLRTKPGLVLACMEGMKYKVNETTLSEGDRIFLYTDGVTEATDKDGGLYGEERLKDTLNSEKNIPADKVPGFIQDSIDGFISGAEQFDDITMLVFDYKGKSQCKNKVFPAKVSELDNAMSFLEEELENAGCPQKCLMQISLSFEEAFVNVANYAYPGGEGTAELSIFAGENKCEIILSDAGVRFNPLEKEEPDITLAAEDRKIGGLGIFMIKKQMNSVDYKYENGRNILTMTKEW